jgi:endogenous inhibitor of DNA gyrase (YacG/DUF329 family)
LQDLAHWADGTYRIPVEPVHPAAGDGEEIEDTF